MNTFAKIMLILGVFVISLAIGFGVNAAIVWIVCKIMGWTFAWKWVILFTVIYAVIKSIFTSTAN